MLTAFSYYDPEEENRIQQGMKNTAFFEREREIAHGFAASHQGLWRGTCPACGQEAAWPIFERDGVAYERCRECGSLFAAVKDADVAAYFAQEDLRSLRCSDEYQENSTESRSRRWDDILAWLGFRAFRYLGHSGGLSIAGKVLRSGYGLQTFAAAISPGIRFWQGTSGPQRAVWTLCWP